MCSLISFLSGTHKTRSEIDKHGHNAHTQTRQSYTEQQEIDREREPSLQLGPAINSLEDDKTNSWVEESGSASTANPHRTHPKPVWKFAS